MTSRVDAVVNAVLYEGYMLYPYRPSSVKNRQRWTFGGVYPQAWSDAQQGAEPWIMQTQCVLMASAGSVVEIRIGFLHLIQRQAGEWPTPLNAWPARAAAAYRKVDVLKVGEQRFYTWQEAVERKVALGPLNLHALAAAPQVIPFAFPARNDLEPFRDVDGVIFGVLERTQDAIEGSVAIHAEAVGAGAMRVEVKIMNATPIAGSRDVSRDAASLKALVSCHTILSVHDGQFISMVDPPEALQNAVASCRNIGTWPILVGEEGTRDTMLSSPIILYDYPQIAPESPGDLFDATEIDEILTLRILSMTDEEKREMAAVDERSRALLERTEKLAPEQLQKLHGTLRALRPVEPARESDPESDPDETQAPWEAFDRLPRLAFIRVGDVELRVGNHVRLHPRARADIMDLALAGKLATIESIERDFEDRVHVAVTVDDDPGREFGLERMPGHRFFFAPDEVEPFLEKESVR